MGHAAAPGTQALELLVPQWHHGFHGLTQTSQLSVPVS